MNRTLGWAVYLACSWTWCIGMFLPSLLMRDGGASYFWAFLIPNVVGAASVGWVLHNAERSRRFVASKRPILLAFTAVTIAFHAFWLTWRVGEPAAEGRLDVLVGVMLGGLVVLNVIAARNRVDWLPALAALAITATLGVILLSSPPEATAARVSADLAGLAAITALGFGLCSYLDLTFNRAAQHAPSPRTAFSIGFSVIFAAIILVSTGGRAVWSPAEPLFPVDESWILIAMGGHFGAQAVFTVSAHIAALRRTGDDGSIGSADAQRPRTAALVVAPIAVGCLLALAALLVPLTVNADRIGAMDAPELVYRLFLGCYGLVFPAWLILSLGGRDPLARRTLIVLTVAVSLATPFAWIGMIGLREVWLLPAVAIILLSRAFSRRPATTPSPT